MVESSRTHRRFLAFVVFGAKLAEETEKPTLLWKVASADLIILTNRLLCAGRHLSRQVTPTRVTLLSVRAESKSYFRVNR